MVIKKVIRLCFKVLVLVGMSYLPVHSLGEDLPLVTYDFPPYNYIEEGQLVGASTELVQSLLKEMGYTPVISSLPFKRAQRFIEEGQAAVIFTYTHSIERRETAYLSNPVSYISGVFSKEKKKI